VLDAVDAVVGLVASGAVQGLSGQAAIEAISEIRARIRKVFGHDHRAVEALEKVSEQPSDPAVLAELAAALRWHAERNQGFTAELERWAGLSGQRVVQNVRAERDAYTAARDQTIIRFDSK